MKNDLKCLNTHPAFELCVFRICLTLTILGAKNLVQRQEQGFYRNKVSIFCLYFSAVFCVILYIDLNLLVLELMNVLSTTIHLNISVLAWVKRFTLISTNISI